MTGEANPLNYSRQAGFYAPDITCFRDNTLAPNANRAYFARFVATVTKKITVIAFAVNVAATNDDSIDVGIYDAAGNRLASSGATAGKVGPTAAGAHVATVSLSAALTLTRGTAYYAALAYGTVGGTAATLQTILLSGGNYAGQLFGSGIGAIECFQKDTSYPLPSSVASPVVASQVPLLAVRES